VRRFGFALFLIVLAGCGGSSSSAPRVPATLPAPTPAAASTAAPTPPAAAGPSQASMTVTYSASAPTVNLPTVGNVASQVTFPDGFAPDGTQVNVQVFAGAPHVAATSGRRTAAVQPSAISGAPAWSFAISSTTPVQFGSPPTITLAPAGVTPTAQSTLTYYSVTGSSYTELGVVGPDSFGVGSIVFSDAQPCAPNGGSVATVNGATIGPSGGSTVSTIVGGWKLADLTPVSRRRTPQDASSCAAPASAALPAFGSGVLYVQDPGAGAIYTYAAGAMGNTPPFVALNSAPSMTTDFSGELITEDQKGATIREYGGQAPVDILTTSSTAKGAVQWIAADPLGAHIALLGNAGSKSFSGGFVLPTISLYNRAQGGTVPPVSMLLNIVSGGPFTLDAADDAFTDRAGYARSTTTIGFGCGVSEFVLGFGGSAFSSGSVTQPYRTISPTPCNSVAQIAVDSAGSVYVAEPGCCIEVFAPGTGGAVAPTYLLQSPGAVDPTSGFNGPEGVAVDPQGNVYISSPEVLQQASDGSLSVLAAAAIYVYGPPSTWGANPAPLRTIAGNATGLVSPGLLAIVPGTAASPPASSGIVATPAVASLTALGQTQSINVSESGYSGAFTQTNTCGAVANVTSASNALTVTANAPGTCYATVADSLGHSTVIGVAVTTTSFTVQSRGR
jgi:hypothetical protein